MHVDEKACNTSVAPTKPISEPLTPLVSDGVQRADDEDDSPDVIFFRAVAEIPTQPLNRHFTPQWELNRQIERECAFALFLFLLLATAIVRIINQPVITVTLVPVHQAVTTPITTATRTLSPVTITRTLTAPTTGHGHQDATRATGTLTFYKGSLNPQTIAGSTLFTGSSGIQIVTDEPVTIPAANPPQFGQATVSAHAVHVGSQGNIPSDAVHVALSSDLLVKNLVAFTGGRGARDFQAAAQRDLDSLTAKLQHILSQAIPQAFSVALDESVTPTNCSNSSSANHAPGEEARAVTMNASQTCSAVVYSQADLTQKATIAFNATRPGKHYELANGVRITILSITPFTVRLSGSWAYAITQDDEQFLAQQIQGDTPKEARAHLFKTGFVSRVTMTRTDFLPDFYHIKFLILTGV